MAHFPLIFTTCLRWYFHEHGKKNQQKDELLFSQADFCSDILQQDRNYFSRKINSHLHTQNEEKAHESDVFLPWTISFFLQDLPFTSAFSSRC